MALFKSNSNVPEIPVNPEFTEKSIAEQRSMQTFPSEQKPQLPAPDAPTFPNPSQPMQKQAPAPEPVQKPVELPASKPNYEESSMKTGTVSPVTGELHKEDVDKSEPFFVRIDKFKETKEHFENVYVKVKEVEDIVSQLEHAKEQEDKELEECKLNLKEMKSTLSHIDKEIFSKI